MSALDIKAGWRPAIGWVCVISLALQYVIFPILTFFWQGAPRVVGLDGEWLAFCFAMAGLRTYDKRMSIDK